MMTIRNVLFDLDGTLTDPKVGITRSVQYSLAKLGIEEADAEQLTAFIGPPLWESYEKYYGFDEAKANSAVSFYREYFSREGIFENSLYDGIEALLSRLNERGLRLFIATSKPTVFSTRIAEHFGIAKHFESIEGSELDGRLSNKAELIAHILEKRGLEGEETIMVGDREHDIRGAKANGLESAGVGYGYGSREELEKAGATYFAGTVAELEGLLLRLSEAGR